MNKVFEEADVLDLTDLAADPNKVVEVQSLIRELLETGDKARQLGIRQRLVEEIGPFGLPGIISATYTLQDALQSHNNRELVADLIVEVAGDNPEAHKLIVSAGLINAPFNQSRIVCQAAAAKMQLGIDRHSLNRLKEVIEVARNDDDVDSLASLLGIWLCFEPGKAYESAMQQASRWLRSRQNAEQAYTLINQCLRYVPEKASQTFESMLNSLAQDDKKAIDYIAQYISLDENTVFDVMPTVDKLLQRHRGTARPHEGLVKEGIGTFLTDHPDSLSRLSQQAEQCSEKLHRYWWIAVSNAAQSKKASAKVFRDALIDAACNQEDTYYDGAVVQLLFVRHGRRGDKQWAIDALERVDPWRRATAEETYEQIRSSDREYQDDEYRKNRLGGISRR